MAGSAMEVPVKRSAMLGAVAVGVWLLLATPAMAETPAAGPPYPEAVTGQRVYDNAGIFSSSTISQAQEISQDIERRTGAQVVVYTQVKPQSDSLDKANADALALMNQWGVGRKGFDDGLVILFDMQSNLNHGQVSLYAGSGYKAAFLSDSDRQAIFDNDMKPLLADGDLDGGLMAGLHDVDANATPEHAAALERGRQINALMAVGGLGLGLLLILLTLLAWLRHGRDPVYIDDNSVLMPAPPADLTPAMATLLLAERTSDRTVSAGLIDLAARGWIGFDAETSPDGETQTGIRYLGSRQGLLPRPEGALCDDIAKHSHKHEDYVSPYRLYQLIGGFTAFKSALEAAAVKNDWLTAPPSKVVSRWRRRGEFEIGAGIVVGLVWFIVWASGLLLVAFGLIAAGVVTMIMAGAMPSRTRHGAMLWAMLSAYRRTMKLTLAQAQSMTDVVAAKAVPWITTPDQAMAWGVAFGLDKQVEAVLSRSMVDESRPSNADAAGQLLHPWQPTWYISAPYSGVSGHVSARSSGVFSASAIPDPGSIIAALGSITSVSAPVTSSSSGSSSSFSSGGFGGGGGGGGGGAGGGF
ncbi:MAG TPA: TPM domain-containing protein [Candidatus Limnocylindrales bacterium]